MRLGWALLQDTQGREALGRPGCATASSTRPSANQPLAAGYQRLVEFLGQGIDTRLGHKVTRIDSTQAGAISLTTSAGAQFTARKGVVVAVPLGVLQRGVIQFLPGGLPEANRAAMAQLGMGLLNKARAGASCGGVKCKLNRAAQRSTCASPPAAPLPKPKPTP